MDSSEYQRLVDEWNKARGNYREAERNLAAALAWLNNSERELNAHWREMTKGSQ